MPRVPRHCLLCDMWFKCLTPVRFLGFYEPHCLRLLVSSSSVKGSDHGCDDETCPKHVEKCGEGARSAYNWRIVGKDECE